MIVKVKKSEFADKIEPVSRKIATVFFIIIVVAAMAKDWKTLVETFSVIGPSTLVLNLLTMLIAFIVSKVVSLEDKQGISIVFECGLQNGTLAIFVAATLLQSQEMLLPGAIYSILMFITGGIYLLYRVRKVKVLNKLVVN